MESRSTADKFRAGAAALILFFITACGQSTQVESVALNRAGGAEPGTLDPHRARTMQEHHVLRDLFEGLLRYSADGLLTGGAAERWDVSADGLTYSFWLRPEARWSNGETVVAEDFVYSLRRTVSDARKRQQRTTLKRDSMLPFGSKPAAIKGLGCNDDVVVLGLQPAQIFIEIFLGKMTYDAGRHHNDQGTRNKQNDGPAFHDGAPMRDLMMNTSAFSKGC